MSDPQVQSIQEKLPQAIVYRDGAGTIHIVFDENPARELQLDKDEEGQGDLFR